MIRTTQHTLKFITKHKREKLDMLFGEYQRIVNEYIQYYWRTTNLKNNARSEDYIVVDSWLMGKTRRCAYKQAIQIIRSVKDKQNKLVYKQYKRVYSKAMKRNKNWNICKQKFSEWSKGKVFRDRTKIPHFNGNSIELTETVCKVYTTTEIKEFDLIIRLGSIWGNRESILLPTKKHKHLNKLLDQGFELRKSIRLRRINGNYYVNLYLQKEDTQLIQEGNVIGIDSGIKKLITTSNGEYLGTGIETIIKKYKRRKQGSTNSKKTIQEIKNYIGNTVNKLDLNNTKTVVLEDLHPSKMMINKKIRKEFRKTLSKWNQNLLLERIRNKCEVNRVELAFVNPAYTSQKCSLCGEIHKESRKGELYQCVNCGASIDADYNAALNIRNRFLNKESIVPSDMKINI